MYRSTISLTPVNATSRPLYPPGKTHCTGGWLGGRVRQISSPPVGFDPWTVQPVASRYTYYAIPATCLLIQAVFENIPPLRLLFNQNLGCISCFHHVCFTAVSLWKCLHRGFYGGSCTRVLRDGAVHSAGGKEMCHVWEIDTSRPMDCRDTQHDRFRFLTAEMRAREMAVVATYTLQDKWAKPQYDRQHMVIDVTFPFTFVPVTDNDCRKCLFSHMKKESPTPTPTPQIQRH